MLVVEEADDAWWWVQLERHSKGEAPVLSCAISQTQLHMGQLALGEDL